MSRPQRPPGSKRLWRNRDAFGTGSDPDRLKQAGVGLATAVLIDATIVREVLLPSTMKLLGARNWYLPRWLERIPRAPIEAPVCARALLVQDQQHAPGAKGRCSSIRARAARMVRHHAEYARCL